MKFLADENFPRLAIQVLRDAGFEVLWSGDAHAGAGDPEVLRLCASENRTLLTFDKDFGELAFKAALPASAGILLFRITPQDPAEIAPLVLAAVRARRSEEHTSELQSLRHLVCRLLLEKKKKSTTD